jgi:hypothetical protein
MKPRRTDGGPCAAPAPRLIELQFAPRATDGTIITKTSAGATLKQVTFNKSVQHLGGSLCSCVHSPRRHRVIVRYF